MKAKPIFRLFFFWSAFLFCFTAYGQGSGVRKMSVEEYIEKYKDIAIEEMKKTGIPASIKMAQGILESGYGNSELATKANNHFGIKCHTGWTGKTFRMDDDEKNECFRVYKHAEESYRDHSEFLTSRPRYEKLFELPPNDYRSWAHGLKNAGYATNPNYATLLIKIIEERKLHDLDYSRKELAETVAKDKYVKVYDNKFFIFNNIKTVVVQKGDDPAAIAQRFNVDLRRLLKYNELKAGMALEPGTKLFLQPKRNKGTKAHHTAKSGETMYKISQAEGMKLKSLYRLNQMGPGQEPAPGERIHLKKKRKTPPKLYIPGQKVPKPEVATSEGTEENPDWVVQKEENKTKEPTKPQLRPAIDKTRHVEDPQPTTTETASAEKTSTSPASELKSPASTPAQPVVPTVIRQTQGLSLQSSQIPEDLKIYHEVQPGQTLFALSRIYQISVDEIRQRNKLTSDALIVGQQLWVGEYEEVGAKEKVVETIEEPVKTETKETTPVTEKTHSFTEEESLSVYDNIHTVEPGQTLFSISRQYGISVDKIRSLNGLKDNNIRVGQELKVREGKATDKKPVEEKVIPESKAEPEKPIEKPVITKMVEPEVKQETKVVSSSPAKTEPLSSYHIVESGETFFAISRKYNISVDELKRINNKSDNVISIGEKLLIQEGNVATPVEIPVKSASTPDPKQTTTEGTRGYHTVSPGETLFSISRKYGLSVDQIKNLNNLADNTINPGQMLITSINE